MSIPSSSRASTSSATQYAPRPESTEGHFNQENTTHAPSPQTYSLANLNADVLVQLMDWVMRVDHSEASAHALRRTSQYFNQIFTHYVDHEYYKKFQEDTYLTRSAEFVANYFPHAFSAHGWERVESLEQLKEKIPQLGTFKSIDETNYQRYLMVDEKFFPVYDNQWIEQFRDFKNKNLAIHTCLGIRGLEVIKKINEILLSKVSLQFFYCCNSSEMDDPRFEHYLSEIFSSGRMLGIEIVRYREMGPSQKKFVLDSMCEYKKISYIRLEVRQEDNILIDLAERWPEFRDIQLVRSEFKRERIPYSIDRNELTQLIEAIKTRHVQNLPPISIVLEKPDEENPANWIYRPFKLNSNLKKLNLFFSPEYGFSIEQKLVEEIKKSIKAQANTGADYRLSSNSAWLSAFDIDDSIVEDDTSEGRDSILEADAGDDTDSIVVSSASDGDDSIVVSSASDAEDSANHSNEAEGKSAVHADRDRAPTSKARHKANKERSTADQPEKRSAEITTQLKKSNPAKEVDRPTEDRQASSSKARKTKPMKEAMASTEPKIKKRDTCVIS